MRNQVMTTSTSSNNNNLVVPEARQVLDHMKFEIAQEFGVQLGPDTTSRANGSVGGEMTKRLVQLAQIDLANRIH
ncbi:small, acid-soluble spore protein, alpha/beta type [Caldalkalibacillus mannanilyticus]|uniref:small, acid-soluble spore protein, alpha/beta type n=1 Tax=Caldalkalibacillus mannanilyticus TaxID=1418 RepID=UPI000B1F12D9